VRICSQLFSFGSLVDANPGQPIPLRKVILPIALICMATTLRGQQNLLTQIHGNTDQGIAMPQSVSVLGRQDPAALQEIREYRAAINVGSWVDMQGTGELTPPAADSNGNTNSENATLWIQGRKCRLDIQKANGTSSLRMDGDTQIFQDVDGTRKSMDARDAVAGLFAFPPLMETNFPSAKMTLIDLGIQTVDGSNLHGISFERLWPNNRVDGNGNPLTMATNLYFDPQSHLLIKSANAVLGSDSNSEQLLQVTSYGDYRAVNGMQVPYLYRATVDGQILWTLQLNQVRLNQGLSESDFIF
jgi:hypothetical protein